MPRARGGRRQGTPGKAYSNRTDLGLDYAAGSPASGGMVTQPGEAPAAAPAPARPVIYPEDTPGLLDPTARPSEPITDGLPIGPGRNSTPSSTKSIAAKEVGQFKAWLPMLEKAANAPGAAPSFVRFVRYLRNY